MSRLFKKLKSYQPFANMDQQREYRHAVARLGICFAVTCALAIMAYAGKIAGVTVLLGLSYFLFALAWAVITRRYPGEIDIRHNTTLISDTGMTAVLMYLLGSTGAVLFPVYLLIISGYGSHLGKKYFTIAGAATLTAFLITMTGSPFWWQYPGVSLGLALSLVLIPILLHKMTQEKEQTVYKLDRELQKTTYAATHDATTDLVNRFYFFQRVKEEIQRAQRYDKNFTILYIDLDGFEQINKIYGHKFGDEVLKVVADRLHALIRRSDLIARLGGDEFALLLYDLFRTEDVRSFTQKLIEHLSLPITIRQSEVYITASVGISQYPNHGKDPDVLINKADHAMHQSKSNGKNSYTFFLEEVGGGR
ncbi:MAG: diguanylate cyclase [Gammaproteobacteria bacterium]|nr:diguanylate cyclase [Gammaproteobacteria bacterium]MDH5799457.1 diguanylate cyclase [Gammaproteobacteria bacterium]